MEVMTCWVQARAPRHLRLLKCWTRQRKRTVEERLTCGHWVAHCMRSSTVGCRTPLTRCWRCTSRFVHNLCNGRLNQKRLHSWCICCTVSWTRTQILGLRYRPSNGTIGWPRQGPKYCPPSGITSVGSQSRLARRKLWMSSSPYPSLTPWYWLKLCWRIIHSLWVHIRINVLLYILCLCLCINL